MRCRATGRELAGAAGEFKGLWFELGQGTQAP